ncbi:hypothetical protein ACS0TY_008856 [Phlomoides rotata]
MEKGRGSSILKRVLMTTLCFFFLLDCTSKIHASRMTPQGNHESSPPVKLRESKNHVEIDNGFVKLTLLNPKGKISSVGYKGIDNILEYRNKETQRGYWDIVWNRPEIGQSNFDTLDCTSFKIISETQDQIEVSFTKTWELNLGDNVVPLNIDKRYVVLRGVSGFYSYAIFEHKEGWPDLNIDEARIAIKLHQDMFHYMVISDDKQREMPTDSDRKIGQALDYKEAILLRNPDNPRFRGEVDDKYQYSCDNKDNHVHGWISSNSGVGFWVITPSDEYRAGGPVKPDLTSHAGPTSLAIFFSMHYAGREYGVKLRNGEHWKKVFGPVFMYLNSETSKNRSALWEDAKVQTLEETKKWPYDFPLSSDFPLSNQRGSISGRLLVRDRYISTQLIPAKSAYVGLAPPGDVGSWQTEIKGYQFWTQTDERGYFSIRNIRANTYNLYAWVPGIMGDYKHNLDIMIRPGRQSLIGDLVYDPPRNGPTLWEIGFPDRSAAEFYVPDPAPGLVNKLFINHTEKYRQYGLWDRYTDLYPNQDLIYTVGVSDYRKDWFFAHVNRNLGKQTYIPTTWQIVFDARNVTSTGTYTLRLALASANFAEIQVFNYVPINSIFRFLSCLKKIKLI